MYIWPQFLKQDILYFTKSTKDQPSDLLCISQMQLHSVQLLWCSPLFVLLILPELQTEIIPLLITDCIIKSQLLSRGARMSGSNISSLVSRKKRKKNLKRVPILFSSKISFNAVIHQNKTNLQYMFFDIIFMTTIGYRVIYPRT